LNYKKIIFAVFLGLIFMAGASWLSSEKMKHDDAKKEKAVKVEAAATATKVDKEKNFNTYVGTWIGQDDNSIHITIANGDKKNAYTITIAQKGKDTKVISLPIKEDGTGIMVDDKKIEYHVEFTKFYEKSSKSFKPSIEIYTISEGSDNASEQDTFIRAFKQ
jgi:ribosomal protein L21E